MSEAKTVVLARTQSARSTTAARSTTPGSSVPRCSDRAGTTRAIAAAYSGSVARSSAAVSVPGARRRRAIAIDSTRDQSTRPSPGGLLDVPASDRDRRPHHGPDDEPDLPQAVLGNAPPATRIRGAARTSGPGPKLHGIDVGK